VIHWDQAFLAPRDNLEDRDLPESYTSQLYSDIALPQLINAQNQHVHSPENKYTIDMTISTPHSTYDILNNNDNDNNFA